MVHEYMQYPAWKKGVILGRTHYEDDEDEEVGGMGCEEIYYSVSVSAYKRTRIKFLVLFFLSFLSCSFIFAPLFFFSRFYCFGVENGDLFADKGVLAPLCSSVPNGTICCDRNSIRSDICTMKGDIRTHSSSSSIFLYTSPDSPIDNDEDDVIQVEKIKPYTRKWEKNTMDTIDELELIVKRSNAGDYHHRCDVRHGVPAVFFSTGGYTGNVYHEFNDGILPLYITSNHMKKEVVFVILEYHNWWFTKYGDILSQLSNYPPIDFRNDNRTHCFPQAIAGLRIHDELSVEPSLMEGSTSIVDFRNVLDMAYRPRIQELSRHEEEVKEEVKISTPLEPKRPKLVVLSRKGSSREITNENLMVKMAENVGFEVKVVRPDRSTELAKIYRELNQSDVMVGVHGAAMTHFLFMRPNAVFIQIVPLGTVWAAETYYGEPAKKLGLKYIGYEIQPKESSLYSKYNEEDPVLVDPDSITQKGWEYTKKIYLDGQNVRLNLARFQKRLDRAYYYCIARTRYRGRLE
ncbi:EGF domain-specific O-linked N-acetylglucosamine transferase-like [Cucurbita moschata]|uniref:EGF domain-specific O-linked N-acetylglucosamine transferase-like n=1 Tax=Cucurbita moschata TaxID=3662 RepID=A0A6J1ELB6_CUCMO|nr:EGF domain-specific O-linked N-acetylglucosamine transferase-like [Cucurbita moschata]